MDKEYWKKFYLGKLAVTYPSSFANFCVDEFLGPTDEVLELGCGNGRDAVFLAANVKRVVAVDQSIEHLKTEGDGSQFDAFTDGLRFVEDDFVEMDYGKFGNLTAIYSRFTLHAILLREEEEVLRKVSDHLAAGGLFLIEARTTKDSVYGQGKNVGDNAFVTDHYRRFIDVKHFKDRIMGLGFEVVYLVEDSGLSEFKGEDPVLMRMVAKKR